jgi:hypothetical protein
VTLQAFAPENVFSYRAEGLACVDLGPRTPIGMSGNLVSVVHIYICEKPANVSLVCFK